MINHIHFRNYKSFKDIQELELRPLTILIGKNSSGKSAVAKLPTMIEGSLSGKFQEPLLVINDGIELGAEFRDLVYGREIGSLEFILKSNSNSLEVEITSGVKDSEFPRIRKWSLNGELKLSYNDNNHSYLLDSNKTNYDCNFLGFELNKMSEKNKLGGINDVKQNLRDNGITLKTNYIGPFRQIPERIYNIVGTSRSNKIGNKGENAYQILISDFLYYDGELLKKISNWYKANFDGWGIDVNIASKPDCKIELTRDYPKFNVNIRDVGEGMSQALPLVVSAFLNSTDDMLTIIEQPELHLHPAAHGSLAELFAKASKNSTNRFLIETHSQNFILRLRRLVAEGEFNANDIVIYSVEYDEESNQSNLKRIDVNDLGEVSYWPENVFSETLDETIAIRTAQIKKGKNGNRN
jgi:predicted ATPase